MASKQKRLKELKRRYGKLAEHIEPYYHQLDLRPFSEMDDEAFAYIMQQVRGVNMLDLNETEIGNDSMAFLTRLEYVKELRLKGCYQINDGCIPYLNQLTQLEFLHLNGTGVTIDGVLQLTALSQLKTLLFKDDNEPAIQQAKLAQLQQLLPQCSLVVNSKPWSSNKEADHWE